MQHDHSAFTRHKSDTHPEFGYRPTLDVDDCSTPQLPRTAFRGIVYALPVAALLWAIIILVVWELL